jgi:hypothetical protein
MRRDKNNNNNNPIRKAMESVLTEESACVETKFTTKTILSRVSRGSFKILLISREKFKDNFIFKLRLSSSPFGLFLKSVFFWNQFGRVGFICDRSVGLVRFGWRDRSSHSTATPVGNLSLA